jgi:hypothetical protein
MVSVDMEFRNRIVLANDTGDEPGEIVYTGQIAVITGVLTKWDIAAAGYDELGGGPQTTKVAGAAGDIGECWVVGTHTFATILTPTRVGEMILTFPRCFVDGPGAFRLLDFGNDAKKLGFIIMAMRDGSDNVYTETAVV